MLTERLLVIVRAGLILASVLWATGCLAEVPRLPLPVRITCPSVPAGAMAQVRIWLATPRAITSGRVVIDFDKTVFGAVASADVFSATGDQIGVADIQDRHVDVRFQSVTGGIGRLPGLPVAVVNVPVLPSFVPGRTVAIALTPTDTEWRDVEGYQYRATAEPIQMRVGGSLAIGSVTPGGGALPAGAKVRIAGVGFEATSAVEVDGVAIQSTAYLGRDALEVTLAGEAELTGKRVTVRNRDGTQADFYSALRGRVLNSLGATVQPIFSQRTYARAGDWPAVQNPHTEEVRVTYEAVYSRGTNRQTLSRAVTLGPGDIYLFAPEVIPLSWTNWSRNVTAEQPVRLAKLSAEQGSEYTVSAPYSERPRFSVYWVTGKPQCSENPYFGLGPDPPCVVWLAASPLPKALAVSVTANGAPTMFTVSITTTGNNRWLAASVNRASTGANSPVSLTFHPEGLAAGEYKASVTFTPELAIYSPVTLELVFRVTATLISVKGSNFLSVGTDRQGRLSDPIRLEVTSVGEPARFTVRMRNRTFGEWLKFDPEEGITPAVVSVTVDPSKATGWNGLDYVVFEGPANSVILTTMLGLQDKSPPPRLYASSPVTFWAKQGASATLRRTVTVSGASTPYLATIEVEGTWLSAASDPPGSSAVVFTADPTGLAPGRYEGTVTISSPQAPEYEPARVAVKLTVYADLPLMATNPRSIELTVRSGAVQEVSYSTDIIEVISGGTPIGAAFEPSTESGVPWLKVGRPTNDSTLHTAMLGVDARNLPPGEYRGTVAVTAPPESGNTVSVPVTLRVTGAALPVLGDWPPLAVTMVNGASQVAGAVAAGEAVTIYGLNVGPGSQVLFDGIPGAVQYASQTQVNAVIPEFAAGWRTVTVVVKSNNGRAAVGTVPVVAASPALFTLDGSGVGQANAFHTDGTRNGATNAAVRGAVVTLLATGLGVPVAQPIGVTIGGVEASIVAIAPAASGVTEVRVTVPANAAAGVSVPVVIRAGQMVSPGGVTIAVR